jgi:protein CpxP
MRKRFLIAAGLVAALAGGALAWAQEPQPGPGVEQRRGPRGGRFGGPGRGAADLGLRGIDLTDAQREQVRSIMDSHQAEFRQVHEKVREAHRAFAEATHAEPIDEAAIRTRSTAVANAMADEAVLRAKLRAEVFAILTAEQQQQLRERRAEREKRIQERRK